MLVAFDDMIADTMTNKKFQAILNCHTQNCLLDAKN